MLFQLEKENFAELLAKENGLDNFLRKCTLAYL